MVFREQLIQFIMTKDVNNTGLICTNKWYNNIVFPIVPIIETREGDDFSAKNFTIKWLFFTMWTLENISIELSIVCNEHWGFGVIGTLPYLRWAITIPIPDKLANIGDYFSRTPKSN